MKLTEFMWLPYSDSNDDYRSHIASAAIEEDWGQDRRYLFDYLRDNFELAHAQGKVKVSEADGYCLFRVGTLSTREGEPITILATKNRVSGKQPYVYTKTFTRGRFTVRTPSGAEVSETAPQPPEYKPPAYGKNFQLVFNFVHYLEDHEARIAEKLPQLNPHQRFLCLYAALQLAHKRSDSCAVPQWYCDKKAEEGDYQWLLPLHVTAETVDSKPDFVATLDPISEHSEYNIRTILPPEYAYGHARAVSGRDPHFRTWA
jgi:hypothetical protein